jgi:hypothetical protein
MSPHQREPSLTEYNSETTSWYLQSRSTRNGTLSDWGCAHVLRYAIYDKYSLAHNE